MNIQIPFTLCIGVNNVISKGVVTSVARSEGFKGPIHCDVLPNRGRNFSTLLYYAPQILQHDLVLHIHSKKSKYTSNGQEWMQALLSGLVGSKQLVNDIIKHYQDIPTLGLVYPSTFERIPYWAHQWLKNFPIGNRLLERLGVRHFPKKGYFPYPVGGMFWARVEALRPLFNLHLTHADFDEEKGQIDGTLSHAIERVLVLLTKSRGFDYLEYDRSSNRFLGNFSLFNLRQYAAITPSRFANLLQKAKLVSFDVFDTLVLRPSLDPDSIMKLTNFKLDRLTGTSTDFFRHRKAAEARARDALNGMGDVSLREIYRHFEPSGVLSDLGLSRVRSLESETDLALLSPRPQVIELIAMARQHGARIVMVSDTYYESSEILPVLEKCGMRDLIDQVYLSSECNARKDRGDLWDLVLARENCAPAELLHVGDNEQSDIQQVSDRGGLTFHLMNPATAFELDFPGWQRRSWGESANWTADLVLGPSAKVIEGSPFRNETPLRRPALHDAFQIGYAVFGPVMWSFFSWLVKLPSFRALDLICFLSREGYLLQKIYNTLKSAANDILPAKSCYLLASRKAVLAASSALQFDPREILRGFPVKCRLGDLLNGRIGVTLADEALNDIFVDLPRDTEKIRDLLMKHSDAVSNQLHTQLNSYRSYLQSLGLSGTKKAAVVDIGYSGTIQFHLQKILNSGLQGYYFATTPTAARLSEQGGNVEACFDNLREMHESKAGVVRHSIIMEAFLSSPSPSLSCFTGSNQTEPRFEKETRSKEDISMLENLHAGAEAYIGDMLKHYGPDLLLSNSCIAESQLPLSALAVGTLRIPEHLRKGFHIEDGWYATTRRNGFAA